MTFLNEHDARALIRRQIATSKSATLAVAFWGEEAASELGLLKRKDPVSIICNLTMGGTNPNAIRHLLVMPQAGGRRVTQNDTLHAKVYLFDDVAVVGSSNASASGLGFHDQIARQWLEANVAVTDPTVLNEIRLWVSSLITRNITGEDLKAAERLRGRLRVTAHQGSSLLAALRDEPKLFTNHKGGVAGYRQILSDKAETMRVEGVKLYGRDFSILENWHNIPRNRPMVSLYLGPRGGFQIKGIWTTRDKDHDKKLKAGDTIQQTWRQPHLDGLLLRNEDKEGWRAVAKWLLEQRRGDLCDAFASLSEVARAIADGTIRLPA
jgi:hypothetical protein